jgi:di/tricarboxylate transporter
MAVMVGHGAIGSTVSPFTAAGVVANQKLVEIGLSDVAWKIFAWNVAANSLAAAGGFVLLGGWRLWRKSAEDIAVLESQSPVTFERRHWLTMGVIGLLIAAVVIGKTQVGMTAFACAALLSLLRATDEGETLRRIPWSVLVMVCGISVLTSLLEKTGGNERFAQLIAKVSSPATLPALVAFVTGIVSIYSSTTGVVLPVLLPLVKDIAASHSLSNPLGLALAVLVVGNLVDMSPLSTIGAICLAAAPVDCDRRRLFNQLLAWGFAMAAGGAVISWVCF